MTILVTGGLGYIGSHTVVELLKNNFEVAAVITAPDKPAGRGQKVKYSDVKEYALNNNLKILQPTNLKDESFLAVLSDIAGVVAGAANSDLTSL